MDRLVIDAEGLLTSIKMGAGFDKNNRLLEIIHRIESSQTVNYVDPTKNYFKSEMSELQLKQSYLRKNLEIAVERLRDTTIDDYTITNLVSTLKMYKDFNSQLESAKKNNNELSIVVSTFGEYSATKIEIKNNKKVERYKTSEELADERNERLAMLNEMYALGKIDDEKFMKAVISVRRVYQREMETALSQEVVENSKEISKNEKISDVVKNRFKALASKLSKVFKLNTKHTETKQVENYNKLIINKNAMQALGKAFEIIVSTEDLKRQEVSKELCELSNTSQEIRTGTEEKFVVGAELACKIMKLDIEQYQDTAFKNLQIDRALNFGGLMVPDSTGRYVPNKNIKKQKEAYIEYMHNHNEIVYDVSSGVPVEKFKDENVAREYAETLKKFDKNIEKVKELIKQYEQYNQVLKEKFEVDEFNV